MAFWRKKTNTDPDALVEKGARINRLARELRRVASNELTGSDVWVALLTALGDDIATTVPRRNPNYSPAQTRHVLDEALDTVCSEVRDVAYRAANLPSPPQRYEGEELTPEEFQGLTLRIIRDATKNDVPVLDALGATAKALGVQISIVAERGISADELIQRSQDAVAEYAQGCN